MNIIGKLSSKILLSIFSIGFFIIAFFVASTVFAQEAHAGPQGFGWVSYQSIGGWACNSTTSQMVVRLYTENGALLSGGSITLNGVTGPSGSNFGCMNPAGGFFISASLSGYQSFSSAFSLQSSVVTAGKNHIINIAVYLTNTRTIEIVSPTSGNFATSPVTFTLFTRALPAIGASSATIYAIVDGSYVAVSASSPFGTFTVPVAMSNGTHTVAFAFRQNTSPYPISAVTGTVTITVGPPPPPPPPTTGTIQGYKVVGRGSNIEPARSQTVRLDSGSPTTANPYYFRNVRSGSHTVSVSVPALWGVGYTLCYNRTDCHGNTPVAGRSVTVNVPAGGYADLWWHYSQPPPTCTLTAAPRSINAGDSTTISWTLSSTVSNSTLYEESSGQRRQLAQNLPATGSRVESPTVDTTYIISVRNASGQTGQCTTAGEILSPSPVPTPTQTPTPTPQSPPPTPPPPETITLIPNQCENALETEKLTDNYITEPGVLDPPIDPLPGVTLTGTLNQEVTIPINVSYLVDFSKLQALFGYPNSDYLEGRFQQSSHRDENLLELKSADFNNFHGPAQKAEPKYLSDLEKVKYVHYVYNKPEIAESPNKYANIKGLEPKTIKELVDLYGLPVPPSGEDGRGFCLRKDS